MGYIVKKEQKGISFKGKDCNKIESSFFDLSVLLIFSFDYDMLQNSEHSDTELYSHTNMHRKKIWSSDTSRFKSVQLSHTLKSLYFKGEQ